MMSYSISKFGITMMEYVKREAKKNSLRKNYEAIILVIANILYSDLSGMSVGASIPTLPTTTAVRILSAISDIASIHVSLSIKSTDLAAPSIWLAPNPPKVLSSPPPLGFCISITKISIRLISAIIIDRNVVILNFYINFKNVQRYYLFLLFKLILW